MLMINYWRMPEPKVFGIYHIICILIVIAITILMAKRIKNPNDKTLNKILFITGIIMILFEVYKELTYILYFNEDIGKYEYDWEFFPFQFCSTAIYIVFISSFLKPGKFKDSMLAFLATYSLFAGLTVFAYPEQVFIERVGINIQTMVHHGLQIIIGTYLLATGVVKFDYKTLVKGTYVFIALFLIAITMNVVVYNLGIAGDDEFNMFYIGPYYECTLPLVSLFYPKEFTILKYLGFICIYVLGFVAASGAVLALGYGLKVLILKIQNKCFKKAIESNKE